MPVENTVTAAELEELKAQVEEILQIVTANQELLQELAGEDEEEIMFD